MLLYKLDIALQSLLLGQLRRRPYRILKSHRKNRRGSDVISSNHETCFMKNIFYVFMYYVNLSFSKLLNLDNFNFLNTSQIHRPKNGI